MDGRFAIAVHEAGHAIMAEMAGLPLQRAVLRDDAGYVAFDPEAMRDLRILPVSLAGIAAQKVFGIAVTADDEPDILVALGLLAEHGVPDPLGALPGIVAALGTAFNGPHMRALVDAVATELCDGGGVLSAANIRHHIDNAPLELTDAVRRCCRQIVDGALGIAN